MNKKQKSEKLIEADKLYEQLKNKHKEFFDKVGNKRMCDFSIEELRYAFEVVYPEIPELLGKDKEESK
jgi:hypothetical protein